jgi:hypothetical protein
MRSILLLAGIALVPAVARAQAYTMTVYGYQKGEHRPGHSHTWAVFAGPGQRICISWGPRDRWRLFGGAVPGRNRGEAETLDEARRQGATVTTYGPYAIDAETFKVARSQAAILDSGYVMYKVLDGASRPWALNCIHAVSDIGGPLHTGTLYGHKASARVAEHLLKGVK